MASNLKFKTVAIISLKARCCLRYKKRIFSPSRFSLPGDRASGWRSVFALTWCSWVHWALSSSLCCRNSKTEVEGLMGGITFRAFCWKSEHNLFVPNKTQIFLNLELPLVFNTGFPCWRLNVYSHSWSCITLGYMGFSKRNEPQAHVWKHLWGEKKGFFI